MRLKLKTEKNVSNMNKKNLTGNYFWTKRWFGGFNLWVEIQTPDTYFGNIKKYVKGNLADMNELGVEMSKRK